ncbi:MULTISPECIES: hypothetical protein [unclassified Streptomyces]|uniref:hypothetical protein n=1 Tax=unclassified Streptomyces TaxID=2593676 RepID=UPI00332DF5AB
MDVKIAALRSALVLGIPDEAERLTRWILKEIVGGRIRFPSLRHPLGFLYVQLDRRRDSVLRLHLWPDAPRWEVLTTSPYHMHAWDLISYVHRGQITNTIVGVRSCPDRPEYRVFDIVGESTVDVLTPTEDLVKSYVVSRETIQSGGFYRMNAGAYHASRAESPGWTLTVALVKRIPGAGERALGPLTLNTHRTQRQISPPEELKSVAQEVLAQGGVG